MVNPSPSQEAFQAMTRASSFPGEGFEGGDTQPLDSQWVERYVETAKSMKVTNATTPKKEKAVLQISPSGKVDFAYNTNATGATPRTCEEGDSGFVNLADWQPDPLSSAAGSESDMENLLSEDEELGEQLPLERNVFQKPAMPTTPSLAGHKRRRSGELLTSDTPAEKTPGFTQAFGFKQQKADVMTGTQLFEQTQARSSPMPDGLRSDPAITRPSPNMQNNLAVSSPTVMMSSPIHTRALPGTAGGPRETYTSLRESQDRRKRAKLVEDYDLRQPEEDLDDSAEDPAQRRFSNHRIRRTLSEDALQTLKNVRVHSRPSSRPTTSSSAHKTAMIDLRTPATAKKGGECDFEVSPDGGSDEEEMQEDGAIDEIDIVGNAADDDQQSQNDEYDELGQTVLRSQAAEPDEEDDGDNDNLQDEEPDEERNIDGVDDAEQDAPQRTLVHGSSQQDRSHWQRRSQTATQHSAIADSQPLRNTQQQDPSSQAGKQQSPNCSYVPGSQYAGQTSQDQASLLPRPSQGPMGPPPTATSKSQDTVQQVVPSSPPLAATNSTSVGRTAELSLERRQILDRFQGAQEDHGQPTEPEIPESDLPPTYNASSRPATAEGRSNTESNNAPFLSARSNLSTNGDSLSQGATAPSPLKTFASQHSKVSSQSPRSKAGVRHFADIVGAPAPPASSGDPLAAVDDLMSDLITNEDQQFLAATSSPQKVRRQKRRRNAGRPTIRSSSPVDETPVDVPQALTTGIDQVVPQQGVDIESKQNDEIADLETRALRNSPGKANQQGPPSPPPDSTPEAVKLRERAGAQAASQLLAKRSSRLAKPTKLSGTGRKAGSKLQNGTSVNEIKKASAKKAKLKRTSDIEAVEPAKMSPAEADGAVDGARNLEIEETVVESHEDDEVKPPVKNTEIAAIAAPHRIFALFKGTYNMFYPATWLGASGDGHHRVRFDDGTVTTIDPHLVSRMELSLGDQVKVDFPGMKNKVWIVKGFGSTLQSVKAAEALTDMHGHETVRVQAKSSRASVAGPNAVVRGEGEILTVAAEVVYLTHSLWGAFSSREFRSGDGQRATSRLETPSTGAQTPIDTETPRSRSRRATASTVKALDRHQSLVLDESAITARSPTSGLFYGMAFAVSYGQVESEKANVTRLIQRNGGTILDDGFEGLFEPPNLNEHSGLRLKAEHDNIGFVALIADKHSRRAKYIQALALNIPTLSGRWIVDSLDTAKNGSLAGADAAPVPWTKYLLAAGESSYLGGAIRSRALTACDAASAKLDHTIDNRPQLLGGEGVLIVASKKSKVSWERHKAFAFLTLALGAGHVKQVSDLQEAKMLLSSQREKWKFVYVDGSVADASKIVFGKGAIVDGDGEAKNKRKRDETGTAAAMMKADAKAMSATDGSVRVVNDEFVIQSLILGWLVD